MSKIDVFYPVSEAIVNCPHGLWQISMIAKLADHLAAAKGGNLDSESRLINRLGQLRRCGPEYALLGITLREVVRDSCVWLRSRGRVINFNHPQGPAFWITARDGKTPRW